MVISFYFFSSPKARCGRAPGYGFSSKGVWFAHRKSISANRGGCGKRSGLEDAPETLTAAFGAGDTAAIQLAVFVDIFLGSHDVANFITGGSTAE